jgi:hypothetical protein
MTDQHPHILTGRHDGFIVAKRQTTDELRARGLCALARDLEARGFEALLELTSARTYAFAYVAAPDRVTHVWGSRRLVERYIAEQRRARPRVQTASE